MGFFDCIYVWKLKNKFVGCTIFIQFDWLGWHNFNIQFVLKWLRDMRILSAFDTVTNAIVW